MHAIETCRTSALGGHVDECDNCGHIEISYNSCRNRHCSKCQGLARAKWLAARMKELLPVTYYHTVLTLPDSLNHLALTNQRVIYGILFRAGSETLLTLGRDPRHVGAEMGFIAVLHTWGQNLLDHPHLHCIVPGGGLSEDGMEWLLPKKTTRKKKFFVHVNVISELFKKKFLFYLKKAYEAGELKFVGKSEALGSRQAFKKFLNNLYDTRWVTYCKAPFGGPEQVLKYLSNYTHRVAISNNRIVKLEDGKVTFRWRDYRDGNKTKLMSLDASEFIRRFLLHILPKNFFKIRYYGILSSRNRPTKLKRCQEILGDGLPQEQPLATDSIDWDGLFFKFIITSNSNICPKCQKGRMIRKEVIPPSIHGPP